MADIGAAAFARGGLTSLAIPGSVVRIGADAFYNCYDLAAIQVDASNPAFSSLDDVLFDKSGTALIEYPAARTGSYSIPSGVTKFGDAFYGHPKLEGITIPRGVTRIGRYSFCRCVGLVSATIPAGVKSLGEAAFLGCSKLTAIQIPDSVTRIGDSAFYGQVDFAAGPGRFGPILAKAIFLGDAPKSMGSNVFDDAAKGFKVSYYDGSKGFSSPEWKGCPTTSAGAEIAV